MAQGIGPERRTGGLRFVGRRATHSGLVSRALYLAGEALIRLSGVGVPRIEQVSSSGESASVVGPVVEIPSAEIVEETVKESKPPKKSKPPKPPKKSKPPKAKVAKEQKETNKPKPPTGGSVKPEEVPTTGATGESTVLPFKPKLSKGASTADVIGLMREHIAHIAARGRPVIAGPFTTELGFELLYWVPLLRWAVREEPSLQGRLTVISRGGPHSWYAPLFSSYVDALALVPREQFLSRRATLKQREFTEFEAELCRRGSDRLNLGGFDVLHPALLFNAYYRALKIDREVFSGAVSGTDGISSGFAASYEPIAAPEGGELLADLPDDYVAVRFYFRPSFPDTPKNRDFIAAALAKLTENTDVVLLNTGIELDEHVDWTATDRSRIHTVDHLMTPGNNLHIQTVVISRARAFVGTYGGLAYLPPFLRVPSISFMSHPNHTQPWHLELANALFDRDGWGSLVALHNDDLPLLDLITAELGPQQQDPGVQVRT